MNEERRSHDAAENPADPGSAALGDLRVLDLSRILAGPWATQALADLGAEVLKIERPEGGDDTRTWGPPFMSPTLDGRGAEREDAAYFTAANRNKHSLAIDFSQPEGAALVRRLAARADVLVENFKLGGLRRYGLDYESLSVLNPRLIYCSITGFGQVGPYAARAGYDYLIQGMGGLMSITGQPEDAPGAGPVKVGVAVCDLFTGLYATTSILAALRWRERSGRGQHIDCSLFASTVAILANQNANHLVGGAAPGRMGNKHPNVMPYSVYAVADGHVIIACGNDRQFARLAEALGLDGLSADARFETNAARIRHREALDAVLQPVLEAIGKDELIARLETAGVPCGPINTIPEVFADPQVAALGMRVDLDRDDGETIPTVAYPARLSATPASYRRAPPRLGADTETVLRSALGIDDTDLNRLRDDGVI
ncbi:MAG: CaiB/BaiF CoA-transferase family protein [Pseudomonadota bacterium]